MLRRTLLAIAASAGLPSLLACGGDLTTAPHGLEVNLTRVNNPAPPTQFSADAGTVTVVLSSLLLTTGPCISSQLEAGVYHGVLTITISSRVAKVPCTAMAMVPSPTTHIVVHGVPSGAYTVVLAQRFTPWDGEESETIVARGEVTVPTEEVTQ